jgi:lipopolysaccharide/colanic/teichoic acid biosynthesis glycosyltransferase
MISLFKNTWNTAGNRGMQLMHDLHNGWYPKDQFFELLVKEKHHCARNKLPITCIVFDFSGCFNHNIHPSNRNYHKFLKEMMTFVTNNSRDYDLKSLCSPNIIAILLMDACLDATKMYITKIVKKIYDHFVIAGQKEYTKIIETMKICSYPLDQIHPVNKIETIPELRFIDSLKEDTTELTFKWEQTRIEKEELSITAPFFGHFTSDLEFKFCHRILKRLLDILGALCGLIIFSFFMIAISIGIKLTSRGPVLFKQKRAGYLGTPFTLLKFRSMHYNVTENSHMKYIKALLGDSNYIMNKDRFKEKIRSSYTHLGKLIRKTSLDELPQFINILKGDMSLVGPRPHPYYEVNNYKEWYKNRLEVKPGLTGLSKLIIRDSAKNYNEAMRIDIWYLKNWSLSLDVKIIFKTFFYVLNRGDAE